jgi:hypothetical protein
MRNSVPLQPKGTDMKALIIASLAVASIVGVAAYSNSREPGADIRVLKTASTPAPFFKDQSRILPFECAPGLREFMAADGSIRRMRGAKVTPANP